MALQLYWRKNKSEGQTGSAPGTKPVELELEAESGEARTIQSGSIWRFAPADRIHCTEGRVWITIKGGCELALAAGSWTQVPADAREVWLSAQSDSTVRLVPGGKELPAHNRMQLLAPFTH